MHSPLKAVLVLLSFVTASAQATVYYVDSVAGNDSNNGASTSTAWKTIDKVNSATLLPGDSVLFNRGGVWRGNLQLKPGSEAGGKIVYGAYGTGNKPRLLGSVALKDTADWLETASGSHIWESQVGTSGSEVFNGSAYSTASIDSVTKVAYAKISTDTANHSSEATQSVKFERSADVSTQYSDVMIFKPAAPIVAGQCYKLTFNAQADTPVTLAWPAIKLMKNGGNFDSYGDAVIGVAPTIGVNWATYEAYFKPTVSASDARVNIYLGKLPTGITLRVDTFRLRVCDGSKLLTSDVGNLIFDETQAQVGFKKLNVTDLAQAGDFWYDAARGKVRLYSVLNPADANPQLEAALNKSIVGGASDVEVRDLDLRYGGAHGIGFANNTQRVLVDGLDISFIGGSLLTSTLRYGNGLQFWLSTQNAEVRNTRISQVYDVGLTAQGDAVNTVDGIVFRNNYVINSEQCFELWTRTEASSMSNVTFTRNTCVGSGHGWSHPQRGANGYDVLMYKNTAVTSNIAITDNIFYNAVDAVVRLDVPWNSYQAINFSGNCYYPQQSSVATQGLLLNYTAYDDAQYTILTKNVSTFNSTFATNTSASTYGDPQLIMSADGVWVPNPVGGCAAKGYAVPSGS
ncbi:hypothetical protein [Duganella guangzhouensis]|nr:hypothetical protein [Duganella guangzhouensis]